MTEILIMKIDVLKYFTVQFPVINVVAYLSIRAFFIFVGLKKNAKTCTHIIDQFNVFVILF